MAKEYSRSRGRMRRASSTRRDDLADWRHLTRPVILENFLNRTGDLRWSRELIDLLLDGLHVRQSPGWVTADLHTSERRTTDTSRASQASSLRSDPFGASGLTGPAGRHRRAIT